MLGILFEYDGSTEAGDRSKTETYVPAFAKLSPSAYRRDHFRKEE